MKRENIKRLVMAAMFMAIGIVLPFLTGQIPRIGNMLLPMHIPVLLCGLICGWKYGLAVGFILPLLRSVLFTVPMLYPNAIAMAFELAAYGFIIGFLYEHSRWKCIISLYRCLIISMLGGRIVWGVAFWILLGLDGNTFTWQGFISLGFLNAIPGILVQLIIIPAIMVALDKTGLVTFTRKKVEATDS